GAVAGRRRALPRAVHIRARRPGERKAPRPLRRVGRPLRGRARRAGAGLAEGADPAERQGDPQDDRRPAEAREPRRRLMPERPVAAAVAAVLQPAFPELELGAALGLT